MTDKVKIAALQMDIKFKENRSNLDKVLRYIKEAADNGSNLIVFPEACISGYVYTSREEAIPYMETIPGTSTDAVADLCRELDVYVIFGLLEKDGDKCFNTAVLIGPQGIIGKYNKIHLPYLGIDRFVDPGDKPFQVWETPIGNIGILICFDCIFPESIRVMALNKADIIALPTNWPAGREKIPGYIVPTRAMENTVNLVATDRVGTEEGTMFIGRSKILDAAGNTLAEAGAEEEKIIYGEVSLAQARQKHIVLKPGEFEFNLIENRRPEFYDTISDL